jgi:hypothetical protein
VWNSRQDVERTFDALAEAVSSGAYRETGPSPVAGPVT